MTKSTSTTELLREYLATSTKRVSGSELQRDLARSLKALPKSVDADLLAAVFAKCAEDDRWALWHALPKLREEHLPALRKALASRRKLREPEGHVERFLLTCLDAKEGRELDRYRRAAAFIAHAERTCPGTGGTYSVTDSQQVEQLSPFARDEMLVAAAVTLLEKSDAKRDVFNQGTFWHALALLALAGGKRPVAVLGAMAKRLEGDREYYCLKLMIEHAHRADVAAVRKRVKAFSTKLIEASSAQQLARVIGLPLPANGGHWYASVRLGAGTKKPGYGQRPTATLTLEGFMPPQWRIRIETVKGDCDFRDGANHANALKLAPPTRADDFGSVLRELARKLAIEWSFGAPDLFLASLAGGRAPLTRWVKSLGDQR